MTQTDGQSTIWLTQEAYDKLQAELDDLKGPAWTEIVNRISAARDEGDLKENGGYHAAKDEQGRMKGRIDQLEDILRRAEVGEPTDDGTVGPGMVVTYKYVGDDDDEAEKFLLGAREVETDDNLDVFSPQSALGSAVVGATPGDTVSYEAPNGKTFEVVVLDAVPYSS
jgi:transcription elongation factor GreA